MRKIYKYLSTIALGACLGGGLSSCADQLAEEFYNPDKLAKPDFGLFFTSAQTQGHLFRYDYGTTYHYMRGFGKMLGLGVSPFYIDRTQNNKIVQPWTDWSGTNFNEAIFEMTNVNYSKDISAMKLLYNGMTEEEQRRNKIYLLCADVIQCYAFQRSTDLYDDIPYSEVGGAFQEQFYAKYDSQEFIYTEILNKLKEDAKAIAAFQFDSDFAKANFAATDLLCDGDLQLWARMANSLRLRMAMRLCHVQPEVSKSIIRELVTENKMLTEYTHDIGFEEMDKTHAFELTFFRGIDERGAECGAPEYMIKDILNYTYQPGDENGIHRTDFDPRLFAIFQPDIHNRYIGLPLTFEDAEKQPFTTYYSDDERRKMFNFDDAEAGPWDDGRIPAMYNRKTYFNFDMKFPVMGSTETNLLLVEAALRWPGEVGAINVDECIKKAIDASTRFYYNSNATNRYSASSIPSVQHIKANATAPMLNEAHLQSYCAQAVAKYHSLSTMKEKLSFILGQKMIHMNIMNPYELYSETRRLVKDFNGQLPFVSTPNVVFQERMFYPASELTNNPDNFSAVAYKNNYTTPVWWTGRTVKAINNNGNVIEQP